jgi:hypothetical protein
MWAFVTDADYEELEPVTHDDEGEAVTDGEPDVLLDVSELSVDEITLEVEDLRARVSLQADVLQLLKLHVGVDAELGRVKLTIKGVQAKALLKVRLDNVARIIDRVMTTIDNNPDLVEQVVEAAGEAVEKAGTGAGGAVGELGAAVGSAVEDVGGAAGDVGRGVEDVVGDIAPGAGQSVGDVAEETHSQAPTEEEPERRRRRRAASSGTRRAKGSRTSRGPQSEGG